MFWVVAFDFVILCLCLDWRLDFVVMMLAAFGLYIDTCCGGLGLVLCVFAWV